MSHRTAAPNDLRAFWMPFTANRQFKAAPRMFVSAEGMHYTTSDGRQVLDGTAGLWCCNAGHCRPKITEAIRAQAEELADHEERHRERESVRASMSFYGSTPNYAFIWDEAGFEGTTARIREKQKAGDYAGMAAQITDEHIATFATESTWDGLSDALHDRYGHTATRLVLYNALADPERLERYGAVAQRLSAPR